MLQYRLTVISNNSAVKTFGTSAMFICGAENAAPAAIGTDHDNKARNRSFRQFLYIPI